MHTNPAVGGPYAGDPVNQYDGCNCGDGIHYANNYTKNLNVGRNLSLTDISDGTSSTFYAGETKFSDNVQGMSAHTDDAGASCAFDPECRQPRPDGTTGPCDTVGGSAYRFGSHHASVLYRGRIDDRYTADGVRREEPTTRDLEAALTAVVAGKKPPAAETAA